MIDRSTNVRAAMRRRQRGFIINPYRYAGGDPFAGNLVLWLKGEGTNNSTTIVDSSASAHTMTAVGDAKISTTQFFSGTASIALDGNDRVTTPYHADFDFGSGDFTIAMRFRPRSNTGDFQCMIARQASGATASDYSFYVRYANTGFDGAVYVGTTGYDSNTGTVALNDTTWYHGAFVRQSNKVYAYLNGVAGASATLPSSSSVVNNVSSPLVIGTRGFDFSWGANTYLDELKIYKGACLYPNGTTFTP
jgi:hypothetical protein